MISKHIDEMVLTREEEAEVDKLVDEFGDVVMDEEMIQNDDLLVDEPGYDAEIIDAISQLSPANAVNKQIEGLPEASKEPQGIKAQQMKPMFTGSAKLPPVPAGEGRSKTSGAEDKKKSGQSSELKGAQASRKLNALRGRPSPRKKGSGNPIKSKSVAVPRHEVFTSAKSTRLSFVSGSVGSQKPPSKKI